MESKVLSPALLPTLGKGLERVIARRLAFEAIERGTIPHNYVCATPKRSATDLILSLVDEIEDSLLNKKETVSLATFDVKRAFDAVNPTRMVKRLIYQRSQCEDPIEYWHSQRSG